MVIRNPLNTPVLFRLYYHDEGDPSILIFHGEGNGEEGGEFPGYGKAYAVARLFAVVGFVVSVEPFKEAAVVQVFAVFVVVGYGEAEGVFLFSLFCRKEDGAAVVAVFHCIVQKDVEDFGEVFFIASGSESIFCGQGQFLSLVFGQKVEVLFQAGEHILHREGEELELGSGGFAGFGEDDEVADEAGHAAHLFDNALGPLVFAIHHFHGFGVYGNNGQRCFQFVAGVGDESFLVFQVLDEGGDGPLGEEGENQDIEDDAEEAEPYGVGEEGVHVGEFTGAVQNDKQGGAVFKGGFHEAVAGFIFLQKAAARGGSKGDSGKFHGLLFREGYNVFYVDCGDAAAAVKAKGEVAGLVGKFRCIFRPGDAGEEVFPPGGGIGRMVAGGHGASVLGDIGHGVQAVLPHGVETHHVDEAQGAGHDNEYGQGGQKDELAAQFFNEVHGSSRRVSLKSFPSSPVMARSELMADSFSLR